MLKNHTYPEIHMTSNEQKLKEDGDSLDRLVTLKIPYLDPIYKESAITVTNLRFWKTVSHLRWFVLRLRNDYIVSPHPYHGFSRPVYMHIECVKYYQDSGYFGKRRVTKGERQFQVDHINNNPLDSSRQNLRITTVQENMHNKVKKALRPNMKPYSSKYKGVSVERRMLKNGKQKLRYKVDFKFGDIRKRPSFTKEKDAARCYRDLVMKYVPEYGRPTPVSDSEDDEDEEEDQVKTAERAITSTTKRT